MESRLAHERQYWDGHARHDPLWAVLSDPAKSGRRWGVGEFMKTGEREIALLTYQLDQLGIPLSAHTALDFGSGAGRLSQALARRCASVIGVDISPGMVRTAERLNQYGTRVRYVQNDRDDLAVIPSRSVDFVYSNITLQHVPPELSVRYLREFFRVLRPGGVLVFQLPSHPLAPVDIVIRAMDDAAYAASITLLNAVPAEVPAGSSLSLVVEIENVSPHEWRQPDVGSLRLGNHWLSARGDTMLIQDDARAVLPQTFAPGQRYVTELVVTTPAAAGAYTAEIDLVHEGVTWFADRGSRTLRFPLTVSTAEATAGDTAPMLDEQTLPDYDDAELSALFDEAGQAETPEEFPMHGVPKEAVLALIAEMRGEVVHIEDDYRAPDWCAFRYFIRIPG